MILPILNQGKKAQNKGMEQPTAEQIEALKKFARINGRTWKSCLRHAWETGRYADHGAAGYSNLLQQVRNNLGPSWLVRFQLPAYTDQERIAMSTGETSRA